jgi:hypothetical protein
MSFYVLVNVKLCNFYIRWISVKVIVIVNVKAVLFVWFYMMVIVIGVDLVINTLYDYKN